MDYYRSAADTNMADAEEKDGVKISPSTAFEPGYVPFTGTATGTATAPNDFARESAYAIPSIERDPEDMARPASTPAALPAAPLASSSSSTNVDSGGNRGLSVASLMNVDEPLPRAPPNSPTIDDNDSHVRDQTIQNVGLETRRPGRPRGGRLPESEQFYRALVQMNHGRSRSHSDLAGYPYLSAHQAGATPSGASGDRSSAGPSHGPAGPALEGAASGSSGHLAGLPGGLARLPPILGFGTQQSFGPLPPFSSFIAGVSSGGQSTQPALQSGYGTNNNHSTGQFGRAPHFGSASLFNNQSQQPPVGGQSQTHSQSVFSGPSHYGGQTQSGGQSSSSGHVTQPTGQSQFPNNPRFTNYTASNFSSTPPAHFRRESFSLSPHPYERPLPRLGSAPPQLPPIMQPIMHDLPPSITERPSFQRIMQRATDPEMLPPNMTPEQAQLLQQSQIHAAKVKFDKVREANNKSAKRGRYKRMAVTVALADEIMRQKAEITKEREETEKLQGRLDRVENVMPGITGLREVMHSEDSPFWDDEMSTDEDSSAHSSSADTGLGITMPGMNDLFGDQMHHNQADPSDNTSQQPMSFTDLLNMPSPSPSPMTSEPPTSEDLALDRTFLKEAHEMRLQLVDAVRGNKLHELGFGCHEEIDAVVQRGRQIRELVGVPDDDWDKWVPAQAPIGRRKRAVTEPEEDDEGGDGRKKGKMVAGRA